MDCIYHSFPVVFLWIETLFKDCIYNSLQSKMVMQISMTGCDEAKIILTNAILIMKVFSTSCLVEEVEVF